MKTTRCLLVIIMVIILMCLDLVMYTSIHAKTTDDLLTFDFERTTVDDALQQITRVTGIKININRHFNNKIVGKSFLAADLEYILRDLFWQENVDIEWRYGQKDLDTVVITIYDNHKDQIPKSPSTKASEYGSNVEGDIQVPPSNKSSVLGNAAKSRKNNHMLEIHEASEPMPAPPAEHDLVPPRGFLSR
jgi:hypothetical protein